MKAFLFLLALAACAPTPKHVDAPLGPGEIALPAHDAESILTIGKSTKDDVRTTLGEATVVDFPSGYDVWVYRDRSKAELVLLFDTTGILTKARARGP